MKRTNSAHRGFTLIELMVTMSVAVILAAVAVPSFVDFIRNLRSATVANDLVTSLNSARSEAIKRNATVRLCPGASGACALDWNQGWSLRDDANVQLQAWMAPPPGAAIQQANGNATIEFNGTGRLTSAGPVRINARYTGCTGDAQRVIRINAMGRVSVTRTNCP